MKPILSIAQSIIQNTVEIQSSIEELAERSESQGPLIEKISLSLDKFIANLTVATDITREIGFAHVGLLPQI